MADIPNILDFNLRSRSQLFTASGSFVVPTGVEWVYVDGSGGGGGGGGGNSVPGGGGGGGAAGACIKWFVLAVTPNSTLTIAIGSAGLGGAVNTNGTAGGDVTIDGLVDSYSNVAGQLLLSKGGAGIAGASPNGGNGGNTEFATLNALTAGGAGGAASAGATGFQCADSLAATFNAIFTSGGGGGGALNNNGGTVGSTSPFRGVGFGSTGGAAGGGGGKGGMGIFGLNGNGGNNGGAGTAATGFGCGGGGGSGNAAGANGSPGFVRLYWSS